MNDTTVARTSPTVLRLGALAAVAGTILSVAGGAGFGSRPSDDSTQALLRWLADRPDWYWPAVYLGFVFGALLWVGAFTVLAGLLGSGVPGTLARTALATAIIGVTVHVIDAALSLGLRPVADEWASASGAAQAEALRSGQLLVDVREFTWGMVLTMFHGVPFILAGLAVVLSGRYPAWLGWLGFAGGAGSVVAGVARLFSPDSLPDVVFIAFALVLSLYMLLLGLLMWPQPETAGVHRHDSSGAVPTHR